MRKRSLESLEVESFAVEGGRGAGTVVARESIRTVSDEAACICDPASLALPCTYDDCAAPTADASCGGGCGGGPDTAGHSCDCATGTCP